MTWMSKQRHAGWRALAGLLTIIMLCLPLSFPALGAAGETRVFDQAELLGSDTARLEEKIAGLRQKTKMDVVLVTTTDADGKSARNYADDYYEAGGFGTRKDHSGVLFLIDMDNREIYISTEGTMIRFLTDSRVDAMLDHAYTYAGNGDYVGVMDSFLDDLAAYYQKGIPGGQYNYDTETGKISRYYSIRWYEALIAVGISVFCAGGACLNVVREYGMKRQQKQAASYNLAYRANARFAFRNQNDVLANSFVTQRIIPRSNSSGGGTHGGSSGGGSRSSTHTSSSGRSHGGGGRKF